MFIINDLVIGSPLKVTRGDPGLLSFDKGKWVNPAYAPAEPGKNPLTPHPPRYTFTSRQRAGQLETGND